MGIKPQKPSKEDSDKKSSIIEFNDQFPAKPTRNYNPPPRPRPSSSKDKK